MSVPWSEDSLTEPGLEHYQFIRGRSPEDESEEGAELPVSPNVLNEFLDYHYWPWSDPSW